MAGCAAYAMNTFAFMSLGRSSTYKSICLRKLPNLTSMTATGYKEYVGLLKEMPHLVQV